VLCAAQAAALAAPGGRLAVALDGSRNALAETNLGDLAADAVRAAANADCAFIQASALQAAAVPAGPLTDDTIRTVFVFPQDTVTVLQLDAAHVTGALERSLSILPLPNKGFLQVSGLRVRFDPGRAPGARVLSANLAAANAPLDNAKVYRVAVPESLAKGALGYFRVFNSAPRERTDVTLVQALSRYAGAKGNVSPRVEGRLQAVQ
jgi:2',3'-cyclic-nucleotide 2'-phosphodiesterase (5'-nucleotidase family)